MQYVKVPWQEEPLKFPDNMGRDEISRVLMSQEAIMKNSPAGSPAPAENQTQQAQNPHSGLLDFLQDTFVKVPQNLAAGAAGGVRNLLNLPSKIPGLNIASVPEVDFNKSYGISPGEESPSTQAIGNLLPALTPIGDLGVAEQLFSQVPRGAKFAENVLTQTAPSSIYSGAQSEEAPGKSTALAAGTTAPFAVLSELAKSGNPILSGAAKIALASAGFYGGEQASKALGGGPAADTSVGIAGAALPFLGAKALPRNVAQKYLKGVDVERETPRLIKDKYSPKEVLQAGKDLDLTYLTPGEVTGNPVQTAKETALGRTPEGADKLMDAVAERTNSETNAITKLLQTIFPDEEAPNVVKLYNGPNRSKELDQDLVTSLKENEVVKDAIKKVQGTSAYKEELKGTSPNSIKYWDAVKRAMDDMIENAPSREGALITQHKNDLLKKMDEVAPDYKDARALSERQITRRNIEKKVNDEQLTANNFYRKILANTDNYEKLQRSLRNVPEAQTQLRNMKIAFKNISAPVTPQGATAMARSNVNQERNSLKTLPRLIDEALTQSRADKEGVNLIFSRKWEQALKDLPKASNTQKAASAILKNVGKGAGYGVSQINQPGGNNGS